MSTFDLAKLRRLSEAATKGPWRIGPDGNDPPLLSGDSALCWATISEDVTWPNRYDLELVAYLGTHRGAILRMLEAADALAVQVEEYDKDRGYFGGVWNALGEYKKAKGA